MQSINLLYIEQKLAMLSMGCICSRKKKIIDLKRYPLPLAKFVTNHLCCLMSDILYLADDEFIRIFLINDNDVLSSFFHGVSDMYLPPFHSLYSEQSAKG